MSETCEYCGSDNFVSVEEHLCTTCAQELRTQIEWDER